jgi:hypothetical protein
VHELDRIAFASFVISLRASTGISLPPYKGSALRGAFDVVLKDTVCVMGHRQSNRCILRPKCAYAYDFDTPIPDGVSRMRKYESAPHPHPLLETRARYEPGEQVRFTLTLIGKAIDYRWLCGESFGEADPNKEGRCQCVSHSRELMC